MPVAEGFKVNYYVGAVLAQGGHLRLEDSRIVFSPSSAIDRAMGAKDVVIPLQQIREMECSGVLSRMFRIKTGDKVHKFEGGQTQKFWQLLQSTLPARGLGALLVTVPAAPVAPAAVSAKSPTAVPCQQCREPLQPRYNFCPHCGAQVRTPAKAA